MASRKILLVTYLFPPAGGIAVQRMMSPARYPLPTMVDREHQPGKVFEYLATGKPIIAYTPKGSALEHLILSTRAGWCADPADPGAIDGMLRQVWAASRGEGAPPGAAQEAMAQYARPRQAEQVHTILEGIQGGERG